MAIRMAFFSQFFIGRPKYIFFALGDLSALMWLCLLIRHCVTYVHLIEGISITFSIPSETPVVWCSSGEEKELQSIKGIKNGSVISIVYGPRGRKS
jgi:hypothetical protein